MGKRIFLNLPLYNSPVIKAGCFPAGRVSDYTEYLYKDSIALNTGSLGRLMSEVHPSESYHTRYNILGTSTTSSCNIFSSGLLDFNHCNSLEDPKLNFKISDVNAWKKSNLYLDVSNTPEYLNNFKLTVKIEGYYVDYTGVDTTTYTTSSTFSIPITALQESNNYIDIPISNLIFKGKKNLTTDDKIYLCSISVDTSQSIGLFTNGIEVSSSKSIGYIRNISSYITIGDIATKMRYCPENTFTIPLKISNPIQTSLGTYYPPVHSKELLNDKIMYLTNFSLEIPEQLTVLNSNRKYLVNTVSSPAEEGTNELNHYTNHKWLPQFHEYCSTGHIFNIRKLNSSLVYTPELVTPDSLSSVNTPSKAYIYGVYIRGSLNDFNGTMVGVSKTLEGNPNGTPLNNASKHASVYEVVQQLLLDYTLFKITFSHENTSTNVNITLRDFLNNGIDLKSLNMENITECKFKLYLPSLDYISDIDTNRDRKELVHLAAYLNQYSAVNIQFNVSLQTNISNKGLYIGTNRTQRMFINKNEVLYFIADSAETESYTIPKGTYYCRDGFTTQDLPEISDLNFTINNDNSITVSDNSKISEDIFSVFCSILNI